MGSLLVEPPAPLFEHDAGFRHGLEQLQVEQLVAKASVERLRERILPGRARLDEHRPHARRRQEPLNGVRDELGTVSDAGVTLGPPFVTQGRATQQHEGRYTLVVSSTSGREIVRAPFGTVPISHVDVQGFHLAVPLPEVAPNRFGAVRIERDGEVVIDRSAPLQPAALPAPNIERLGDGRIELTWNAGSYAKVIVRDGASGLRLGTDTSGRIQVTPSSDRLDLVFLEGINGYEISVAF